MNHISLLQVFAFLISFTLGDESHNCFPSSCAEIALQGNRKSGIYTIKPQKWFKQTTIKVYCDMETDGGGWTVLQRRGDFEIEKGFRENFTRTWSDYKNGFGDLEKEFWLGNEFIHILSTQDFVTLRIDMEDFEGNSRVAEYEYFHVANARKQYKITVSEYHGDAGDSISHHSGWTFVTIDVQRNSCPTLYKGGWWYGEDCHRANLNGRYLKGPHTSYADGVNWYHWLGMNYSLKKSEMKIRPKLDEYYNNCYFGGCPEMSFARKPNSEVSQELRTKKQTTALPLPLRVVTM